MAKQFLFVWVFLLLGVFSGPLEATNILMENNTEATNFRVRVFRSDIPGDPGTLYDNVPPGVFIGVDDINVTSVDQYEFYTYDVTDTLESNVLVYSMLWGSRVLEATAAGGQLVHVSLTTGFDETSIGRIVLANTSGADAYWNGNTITSGATNAFEIPSASYTLAEWGAVTRPWGWLPSVTLLQPINFSGVPLSTDQEMMLWLHDHDPDQWVTWTWNGGTGTWDFGSTGDPGAGSGAGGGSGGGGSGGGGSGGGGATGTGTVGGNTITINLNGVALETTQLRNEQELIRIRQNAETNNVLMATNNATLGEMLALMNGTAAPPVPPDNAAEAEGNEDAVEAEQGVLENLWNRAFGLDAAVAGVDPAVFDINFDLGGTTHTVNWDPRGKPYLATMSELIKMIICCFLFYLLCMYLWNWYEQKVESLVQTNPSGTSGQAVLGTNANLASSAINATIIMACVVMFIAAIVLLISSSMGSSLIGSFMTGDDIIDGTHSAFSTLTGQQMIVFLDMVLPVSCIISVCFTYMLVRFAGNTIWIGCTTIIKYANA